jgi:hypothetical protein
MRYDSLFNEEGGKMSKFTTENNAVQFNRKWHQLKDGENFCNNTFRRKVRAASATSEPWGGDDTMYRFADGSMLLERKIVKTWQMFKA